MVAKGLLVATIDLAILKTKVVYTSMYTAKYKDKKIIDAVSTSGCVCPGDILSYECTVTGTERGATIWTGSAFNCYEIVLYHYRFNTGTNRTCNNGAIVGRSLSIEGNNYTSQLNVTVKPDTAGKTIGCIHDNVTHEIFIFSSIIPTITGWSPCIDDQTNCTTVYTTITSP